ncbi:MAG: AAA family ATPase [Candidatus Saccharimonadales bacterium]
MSISQNHGLICKIDKLLQDNVTPIIITIGGPTASGKTTLVRQLNQYYSSKLALLDTDSYYIGQIAMQRQLPPKLASNFDIPEACNLTLLTEHLRSLKSGNVIKKPVYDMSTRSPTNKSVVVNPHKLIVVEGIFANQPIITKFADITICVTAPFETRLARRIERDLALRNYSSNQTRSYMLKQAEQAYNLYLKEFDDNADYLISG